MSTKETDQLDPDLLDFAEPFAPEPYRAPVISDGWDSPAKHDDAQGFHLAEDTDLSPWTELSSAELVYRLQRPEREARQLKAALGNAAPFELDGGARYDLDRLIDLLCPPTYAEEVNQ